MKERDFWIDYTEAKGVISLVPTRHIYGFIWGILIGTSLKNTRFLSSDEWHKLKDIATDKDLIVGFPGAWQQLQPTNYFAHKFLINSSAPLDSYVSNSFVNKGFNGMNVYGTSETGGIGWQQWQSQFYQLLPHWKRKEQQLIRNNEAFDIPDKLVWSDDVFFELNGRIDDIIQIGGENVSTEQVAEDLEKLPGVKKVWIKPQDTSLGTRLFSYFQLESKQEQAIFEATLPSYLNELPSKSRPRNWEIGFEPYNKLN